MDQGECDSCVAFSVSTALAGNIVKFLRRREKDPEAREKIEFREISKQHLVDCTNRDRLGEILAQYDFDSRYIQNHGCNGGGQWQTMAFINRYGAMWEADYAFTYGR